MTETINKFEQLLRSGMEFISRTTDSHLAQKPSSGKWSKKEILGHLIDSGINNLQRFTEIQFEDKPYKIRKYKQSELVEANNYQNANIAEISNLWLALNHRILALIKDQTENTLTFKIEIEEGEFSDLKFLITDYVDHLEHHLKQIIQHKNDA